MKNWSQNSTEAHEFMMDQENGLFPKFYENMVRIVTFRLKKKVTFRCKM